MSTLHMKLAAALVGVLAAAGARAADPAGGLLYKGKAEFGWSFKGHASWGDNWEARAKNEALAQIEGKIKAMVNLGELDTFTGKTHSTEVSGSGSKGPLGASGSVAYADSKSSVEQQKWVNRNNYLIDVVGVSIKPGTEYQKHEKNWKGERTQWYSATMVYEYRIYGLKAEAPKKVVEVRYTIRNGSDRTVRFKMEPSGKSYTLEAGQTFTGMSHEVDGKAPTMTLSDSGRTYDLTAGNHRFFWMSKEKRVGFDRNGN